MQLVQRWQPSQRIEPGFDASPAYSRRSRWSSASNSRRDMTGGGGGRRSWNVPDAVSMNIAPLISRTGAGGRGGGDAAREASAEATIRPGWRGGVEGGGGGRG